MPNNLYGLMSLLGVMFELGWLQGMLLAVAHAQRARAGIAGQASPGQCLLLLHNIIGLSAKQLLQRSMFASYWS